MFKSKGNGITSSFTRRTKGFLKKNWHGFKRYISAVISLITFEINLSKSIFTNANQIMRESEWNENPLTLISTPDQTRRLRVFKFHDLNNRFNIFDRKKLLELE